MTTPGNTEGGPPNGGNRPPKHRIGIALLFSLQQERDEEQRDERGERARGTSAAGRTAGSGHCVVSVVHVSVPIRPDEREYHRVRTCLRVRFRYAPVIHDGKGAGVRNVRRDGVLIPVHDVSARRHRSGLVHLRDRFVSRAAVRFDDERPGVAVFVPVIRSASRELPRSADVIRRRRFRRGVVRFQDGAACKGDSAQT